MSSLVLGMGIVAIVLLVAALASGLVERAPLSFPIIFLGLGFLFGNAGLGLLELDVHNPALEVVALVSLSLVLFEPEATDIPRVTPAELAAQLASPQPLIILDVRSRAHYAAEEGQIPGSVRVPPDQIIKWATDQPNERSIVTYCACPADASSARAARQLRTMGFSAKVLKGGYQAWQQQSPVVPKAQASTMAFVPTE